MSKNFDDFLKTINDKELIKESANYMTTSIVTDKEEKELLYNVAIQNAYLTNIINGLILSYHLRYWIFYLMPLLSICLKTFHHLQNKV